VIEQQVGRDDADEHPDARRDAGGHAGGARAGNSRPLPLDQNEPGHGQKQQPELEGGEDGLPDCAVWPEVERREQTQRRSRDDRGERE